MKECSNMILTILFPLNRIDNYLEESINSLIRQKFSNYKCLVLMPKKLEINIEEVKKYFNSDTRFEFIFLNLDGIAFALNYGLNLVKSKYVARMDADDIAHPNRFLSQIKFLENNPDYGVVGGMIDLIDVNSKISSKSFKYYKDNDDIRGALKYRMPLCHPALMFRTELLFSQKGYLYGNTAEDHELFIRIARNKNVKFYNLPEKVLEYRKHPLQSTDMRHAKNAHANISGFLFTEFLRTGNLLYILGILANTPISRRFRTFISQIK